MCNICFPKRLGGYINILYNMIMWIRRNTNLYNAIQGEYYGISITIRSS